MCFSHFASVYIRTCARAQTSIVTSPRPTRKRRMHLRESANVNNFLSAPGAQRQIGTEIQKYTKNSKLLQKNVLFPFCPPYIRTCARAQTSIASYLRLERSDRCTCARAQTSIVTSPRPERSDRCTCAKAQTSIASATRPTRKRRMHLRESANVNSFLSAPGAQRQMHLRESAYDVLHAPLWSSRGAGHWSERK